MLFMNESKAWQHGLTSRITPNVFLENNDMLL